MMSHDTQFFIFGTPLLVAQLGRVPKKEGTRKSYLPPSTHTKKIKGKKRRLEMKKVKTMPILPVSIIATVAISGGSYMIPFIINLHKIFLVFFR